MRRRVFIAVALVTALSREAAGETWHLKSPSEVVTAKGNKLSLPAGYFLDEKTWQERDLELKALQEQQTRLKAENASLRKTVAEDAIPWKTIACAMTFGAFVGIVSWQMK